MNQLEAILIAKTIRNLVDVPLGYKQEFMRGFLPLLRERVPFFDESDSSLLLLKLSRRDGLIGWIRND